MRIGITPRTEEVFNLSHIINDITWTTCFILKISKKCVSAIPNGNHVLHETHFEPGGLIEAHVFFFFLFFGLFIVYFFQLYLSTSLRHFFGGAVY